jgi:hypothetical protein
MNQLASAEKEAFEASVGTGCALDVNTPLGMVVNPDGRICKIVPGGQAEKMGLFVGCQIIGADDSPVNTLIELKAVIQKYKERIKVKQNKQIDLKEEEEGKGSGVGSGDEESMDQFVLEYVDPKRIARANARVAKIRAEQSSKRAKSLATESAQAKKHAKLEAERADAIGNE